MDPTPDQVQKMLTSLRKHTKGDRVLLHYNGHGVPRPTSKGEIWAFNSTYTQYMPLSAAALQAWVGSPTL